MKIELPAGKYVVAVSGGVDSVVLLDMLSARDDLELTVAHFDHGIRDDSADDALFVKNLANTHNLTYISKREELGKGASEEVARERRYEFLRSVARDHEAQIITAHHADDVVETIAINCIRGTGWRGLAVLDSSDIVRPLLPYYKHELLTYAREHALEWREDSTNQDESYLRNKLRSKIDQHLDDDTKRQLLALRDHQVDTKRRIEEEVARLIEGSTYGRYFFTSSTDAAALELLRAVFLRETGMSPTTPQRALALTAIKVAKSGAIHDVGAGIQLKFTKRDFTVVNR